MIKVERSFPAPEALSIESRKTNGNYRHPEVIARLQKDFHAKCYICEIKPVQDPEVEHLYPHKGGLYKERMFDWNNLFYSCGHCNGIKNNKKYGDLILDCCRIDPEDYIHHAVVKNEVIAVARNPGNASIDATVDLINEVFNSSNTGIREIASSMRRDELIQEMNAFLKYLDQYSQNHNDKLSLRIVKSMLSCESAFSAFKREYIRMHHNLYAELFRIL